MTQKCLFKFCLILVDIAQFLFLYIVENKNYWVTCLNIMQCLNLKHENPVLLIPKLASLCLLLIFNDLEMVA